MPGEAQSAGTAYDSGVARGGRRERGVIPPGQGVAPAVLSVLVLLVSAGRVAAARPKRLVGRIRTVSPRCRSYGPVATEVTLDWRGTKLLEGRLEVVISHGGTVLGRTLSADMALTGGVQCYRMMLPAPREYVWGSDVKARMRFFTKDGAFDLEYYPLYVPNRSQRSLTVCVSEARTTPSRSTLALFSSLRLEGLVPRRASTSPLRMGPLAERPLSTFPAYLLPEDLPTQALGYCAYDLVLLSGDGFGLMRERQLGALLGWVEAGGSVCVVPGAGLKPYHVGFLNDLAGAGADAPAFFAGPGGRLERVLPQGEKDPLGGFSDLRVSVHASHAGVGRAVVVMLPPRTDEELGGRAWRWAAAFLWKVRASELSAILEPDEQDEQDEEGKEDKRKAQPPPARSRRRRPRPQAGEGYGHQPISSGVRLFDVLMPKNIRVIPFGLIVVILVLFVGAIGPLDYYALGLLRRRKLTWLVFPAVSVGFALFTMLLSEIYMGRTDRRRAIEFVDLGPKGKVLRTSRYELVFVARHRDVVTEVENALFTPLSRRALSEQYGEIPPPLYEGRIPARFRATQQLRQWQPQINRTFAVGPGAAPAAGDVNLDWDPIDPPAGGDRSAWWETKAYDRVFTTLSPRGTFKGFACVFAGGRHYELCGNLPGLRLEFLREACVRPPTGLFRLVSQVSPTGGSNFEDVALLDPSDPDQWLLVAVVRRGEDIVVYRRLYHDRPSASRTPSLPRRRDRRAPQGRVVLYGAPRTPSGRSQ